MKIRSGTERKSFRDFTFMVLFLESVVIVWFAVLLREVTGSVRGSEAGYLDLSFP
jgi:hypothetical protein